MQVIKPIIFNSFEFTRASVATYYGADGLIDSAAVDELRLGYDPSTLAFIGPVLEDEATNLIPHANQFTSWDFGGGDIGIEPQINPEGGANSQFMIAPSPGSSPFTLYEVIGPLIGGRYTFSIYAKKKTANPDTGKSTFTLSVTGAVSFSAKFNIDPSSPGVVSSFNAAYTNIKELPNGWFRCTVSGNLVTTGTDYTVFIVGDNSLDEGLNGEGFHYIWGAQFEDGNTETSFIYTTGATATRAADIQVEDPPSLVESNVPEDDAPEWSSGSDYDVGDLVIVTGQYHRVYEAIVASTSGDPKFPPENPTIWLDLGATNRWRVFDMTVGADLQASNEGSIQYLMSLDQPVNSVCLFNCEGVSATVRMIYDGEVIYEETISLISDISAATWWNYFFERRRFIKTVALTDLPLAIPSTIEVIIEGAEETDIVKLGKLVIGDAADLGFTEYGATAGITDYSTKEPDAFGNYYILERRFVDRADIKVVVDPGQESFVKDTLASVRATPAVFIGNMDYEPLIIYGFYKDFSILFSTPASSYCNLQLEGI